MPRKSKGSDEAPLVRRQSARIAAVQAASPAKTPVSSKKKRQSTDSKPTSDDTESQQSHLKSEDSIDGLNGVESSSSNKDVESASSNKDVESVSDTSDLPAKRSKVDEIPTEKMDVAEDAKEVEDFEVIDKSMVPPVDSLEVQSVIVAQSTDSEPPVAQIETPEDLPTATNVEPEQHVVTPEEKLPETKNTEDMSSVQPMIETPMETVDEQSKTINEQPETVDEQSKIIDEQPETVDEQSKIIDEQPETISEQPETVTELKSNLNGQHFELSESSQHPESSEICQFPKTLTEESPLEAAPAAGDIMPSSEQVPTSVTE